MIAVITDAASGNEILSIIAAQMPDERVRLSELAQHSSTTKKLPVFADVSVQEAQADTTGSIAATTAINAGLLKAEGFCLI
jgi:hypothetical protein